MNKRKWKVEEKSSPLKVAFEQYLSLFSVPIIAFLYAVIVLLTINPVSLEGLIAGIWIMLSIASAIVIGLFALYNYYSLKRRFTWWQNILLSILLFIISSFIFAWFIRPTA